VPESLKQAQALFRGLGVDRWLLSDGSVKGLSNVQLGGGRTGGQLVVGSRLIGS
jgi:hypothetical protein